MDAATAALKDSAPPGIGMLINSVALSETLRNPLPSFPITRQKNQLSPHCMVLHFQFARQSPLSSLFHKI